MTKCNGKYVSEIIGDAYKEWNNDFIILNCGTSRGKSTFCIKVLGSFAQLKGKKILYLCNRAKLKDQVCQDVQNKNLENTIEVITYQSLQRKIMDRKNICHYDYIVADECHYFITDAPFNDFTDISYQYLIKQKKSTVIWASATAKSFFEWLRYKGMAKEKNIYRMDKDYSYVDKVYVYKKDQLSTLLKEITDREPESKIVVFCNSASRMEEMNLIYGDNADYFCSKHTKNKRLKEMCGYNSETGETIDCIKQYNDGRVSFDKQILFSTSALDNGINLKDEKIKYIFCEMVDIDSMIQSLGRKRSMNSNDTCVFYIMEYSKQGIQWLINRTRVQLDPVKAYKENYDAFFELYGKDRNRIRKNQIFYSYFSEDKQENKLKINERKYRKFEQDYMILTRMKKHGYIEVVKESLGEQLSSIFEDVGTDIEKIDSFERFLKSLEGKMLFRQDRDRIKEAFENIGVKLRYTGINTFNGALDDIYKNLYQPRFCNKDSNGKPLVDKRRILEDGKMNPNRDKKYWILQ